MAQRKSEIEGEMLMSVEPAMDKAGGFGRYQCFLFLVLTLANNGAGLIVYSSAYNELDPPYLCTYSEPPSGFENVAERNYAGQFSYTVPCN